MKPISVSLMAAAILACLPSALAQNSAWKVVTLPPFAQGPLGQLMMLNDSEGWMLYGKNGIMKTADGGQTWNRLETNITADNSILSGIWFLDEQHGWAVGSVSGQPAIWNTIDGGRSWSIKQTWPGADPEDHGALLDIHFATKQHGMAVGFNGSDAIIVATKDGGQQWNLQYSGSEITGQFGRIRYHDPLTAWCLSGSAIMTTHYGGTDWHLVKFGSALLHDLQVLGPEKGTWVAGAWGNLYYTRNDIAWSKVPLGRKFTDTYFGYLTFVSEERGWASGAKCDIAMTVDGGKSWKPDECPLSAKVKPEVTTGQMTTLIRR